MHSCLKLVDYTWREQQTEDREMSSLLEKADRVKLRGCYSPGTRRVRFESSSDRELVVTKQLTQAQRSRTTPDLLYGRQPPAYAIGANRIRRQSTKIWVPIGHVEYLLNRDPYTLEVNWNMELHDFVCSARKLSEICMAKIIRDWPCKLPSRRHSIRSMYPRFFGNAAMQRAPVDSCGPNESIEERFNLSFLDLPSTVLEKLLKEAIVQRDCAAITGLVAQWPIESLNVRALIPSEELPIRNGFLTKPVFVILNSDMEPQFTSSALGEGIMKGPSLLDAFMLGMLARQPNCKLRNVDFRGFEEDRRVSVELSRLPVLWMRPEDRNCEAVKRHIACSLRMGLANHRLERYFSRISAIYAFHEMELNHGEAFDTVTISLECNMSVDEVAIGLSLQSLTPFRFACNQLLIQRLPEVYLPPYDLIRLFNPLTITQFELEDPGVGSSLAIVLPSALGWLISLRNLRACSLPACLPPPPFGNNNSTNSEDQNNSSAGEVNLLDAEGCTSSSRGMNACRLLNRALLSLRHLQRLGLSRCHLAGQLRILLSGLSQPIEYLNLQDCSLTPEDVDFLVYQWRPFQGLYELNISRNNLARLPRRTLMDLIRRSCLQPPGRLACLSLAFTCLATSDILEIMHLLTTRLVNPISEVSAQTSKRQSPKRGLGYRRSGSTSSADDIDNQLVPVKCSLRVLCIQNFTPYSTEESRRLMHMAVSMPKLRRLYLYPASYAFPGQTAELQKEAKNHYISQGNEYMRQHMRSDIEIH
ncbi:hypothetical protein Ciccas_002957 [Cichlidogyrus casuarinus]|uniref:Uncharacterized protein n=1 Tax=Cichlidogyrus casuarinus TaxID=1844966 RepID=A0ABD2QG63_9PLAT